jgi:aryl-alcohol dehydrogenase-like predicted oxidoreductase
MQTATWNERQLSRLMLGTVQLGMPYGIANSTGQPSPESVRRILTTAIEHGVNCFDTAAAYGDSEALLGQLLPEIIGAAAYAQQLVVTKVQPLTPEQLADRTLGEAAVRASLARSRQRLGLDVLPLVLFHREQDVLHAGMLEELRAQGWLRCWGVSCGNEPDGALHCVDLAGIAALQLPGSLLDQRHVRSGLPVRAAAGGVAVFVRSIFLQGLMLLPDERVPEALQAVVPALGRLRHLATDSGMTLHELALRYLLDAEGVTSVLVGAETAEQVQRAAEAIDRGALPQDLRKAAEESVGELPAEVLTPWMWQGMGVGSRER